MYEKGGAVLQSIRSKVLLAIICITIITACSITIVFYSKASKVIEDNYGKSLYNRIQQMGNEFDDLLKEIYYITVQSSCDTQLLQKILDYTDSEDEKKLEEIADMLREYKNRNSSIKSVYVIFEPKNIIVTSDDYPIYDKEADENKIKEIVEIEQSSCLPILLQNPFSVSASRFLSFIDTITDKKEQIVGYIIVNIEEREIYYQYLDGLEAESPIDSVILNEDGKIVSTKKSERIEQVYINDYYEKLRKVKIVNEKGLPFIGIYYQTKFTDYQFLVMIEKEEILKDLDKLKYYFLVFLFLFLSLSVIFAYFATKTMYHPIKNLTDTMNRVKEGDLDTRVTICTNDEIGLLSENFNEMLERIQELIKQLIQEKILKKDAELEALQYQITPHFMYNTLNSIKFAAIMRGEQELGGLLGDFIELLQASINKKGTFIKVSDEVHILHNYVKLQLFRYENRFQIEYNISTEASGCFVPRLILQPLVENAILHGIDIKYENCKIYIVAKIEGNKLILSVKDNGRGMSEEQIQKLLHKKTRKISGLSGIGVANIRERLELYYGKEGGIGYESNKGGTVANIYLPISKEQHEYEV